jgi:heavy metal sensor kinase
MRRTFLRGAGSFPIRTQMMLWYTLVFAILICLFSAVFYINLKTSLETNIDSDLHEQAQEIADGIRDDHGAVSVLDVTGGLPGLVDSDAGSQTILGDTPTSTATGTGTTKVAHPTPTPSTVDVGPLVRILNSAGTPVYASPAFANLSPPSDSIAKPLHNISWKGTVTARNGQAVRIYSRPLVSGNTVYGVLQVGESLTSLDSTLRSALIELLLIGPGILLLSFLGGYWLAARSFAPVRKITSIARRIKAGDLHERVPVPANKDELQTLAQTFNEMIERLEKSFTRQRRFVADASHELRTPVAAIRSMTDVALKGSEPSSNDEYLSTLQDVNMEVERLGHLINDLLALARADEGQQLREREPVRLDTLAMDVAATIEPLANEKGITLEVEEGDVPVVVVGDEVRLIQVMMNLLDNAIKYTNAGGKVSLRVGKQGDTACLVVSDTGIGISQEHLEHIFERFYRVDPARSRAAGGTGLGLAIVEWIVQAHEGTIQVESQVDAGTTFTVRLPLAPTTTLSRTLQNSYKS